MIDGPGPDKQSTEGVRLCVSVCLCVTGFLMSQWEFLCSGTIRRYLIIKSLLTCDYMRVWLTGCMPACVRKRQ